jgi:hypothetical protein
MRDDVVLAHPYDGGLYYLLGRGNPTIPAPLKGHPYYENLYGPDAPQQQSRAVNLAALFADILLPPADDYLPDYHAYNDGSSYFHPDLRIRVNQTWERIRDADAVARELIEGDEDLRAFLKGSVPLSNKWSAADFVAKVIVQLQLALENEATMIGGDAAATIARVALPKLQQRGLLLSTPAEPRLLSLSESVLPILGLDWQCLSLDDFAAVRQSSKITDYAQRFRAALFTAAEDGNLVERLKALMREAMEWAEIAARVKRGFEVAGYVTSGVGAVPDPTVSVGATVVGWGLAAAQKEAERRERNDRWYLIGPKMREVALEAVLKS